MLTKVLIAGLIVLSICTTARSFYIANENKQLKLEKAELGTEIVKLKTENMQYRNVNQELINTIEEAEGYPLQ